MPRCSHPNCRIADTGLCLEGHKQGCPNLLPDEPAVASLSNEPGLTPDNTGPEPRRFHTGEKLTVREGSRLLNERPARVVLCAGSQESGKTTFLARIGEMFRNGTFSRYRFAGSLTLWGFERASWMATVASGTGRPITKRTRRIENDTFLHLRVHPEADPAHHVDLLISDLAGETFPTAIASREFCVDLQALNRADHLVMFIDCDRLTNQVLRHQECDNARAFLQRVISVKHNPKNLHLQVVFSRWDYVFCHSDKSAQEKFLEAIEADFTRRFGVSFATLNFKRIAARPDGGIRPTDAEIQTIFAHWLESSLHQPIPTAARSQQPARDFSAFGLV